MNSFALRWRGGRKLKRVKCGYGKWIKFWRVQVEEGTQVHNLSNDQELWEVLKGSCNMSYEN